MKRMLFLFLFGILLSLGITCASNPVEVSALEIPEGFGTLPNADTFTDGIFRYRQNMEPSEAYAFKLGNFPCYFQGRQINYPVGYSVYGGYGQTRICFGDNGEYWHYENSSWGKYFTSNNYVSINTSNLPTIYTVSFPIFFDESVALAYAVSGELPSDPSLYIWKPFVRDPYSYDEFLNYNYRRHNLNLSSPYVVYFGNLLKNNHLEGNTLDLDVSVVLPYDRYVDWMHDTIVDYYGGNISLTEEDVHGYFQSQGRPDSWADLKYNYSFPVPLELTNIHFGQAFDEDSPPQGDYGFSFGYSLSDIGLSDSVDNLIKFYLSFPYRVSVYQGNDIFGTSEWYPSYSASITTDGAFPVKPFQPIVPVPEDSPAISMPSTVNSVDGYFDNASDIFNFSNPTALQFFISLILLCPTTLITFAFVRMLCLLAVKFLRLLLGL